MNYIIFITFSLLFLLMNFITQSKTMRAISKAYNGDLCVRIALVALLVSISVAEGLFIAILVNGIHMMFQ